MTSWYPNEPNMSTDSEINAALAAPKKEDVTPNASSSDIPNNFDTNLKFLSKLWYKGDIKPEKREKCRRRFIKGVEIRGTFFITFTVSHLI